jgi:hypothetical protein
MNAGTTPRDGFPERPSQDPAWGWFHIILTAYGAWLYGDPRGFRTRHHREHVEGDYKNPPPPGLYADREARSRESLRQQPVAWTPEWRAIVGGALVAVDPIQQTVSEEIKDAIRRRSVDREKAKACLGFLGQPMGRALHARLKTVHESWKASREDATLVEEVTLLAEQLGKQKEPDGAIKRLGLEDLERICFEYVSG